MKVDRPSTTAWLVAWPRALGSHVGIAEDPYAARFLPGPLRLALRVSGLGRLMGSTARLMAPRVLRHMLLRTRAIDDALRAFLERGGRQALLVGAGYDSRAWRVAAPFEGVQVFEVDHPATQRRKLERLSGASLPPVHVAYVPFDFEEGVERLPASLAAAGFAPGRETFAIWEGVTMYLTEGQVDATLRSLRQLCGPGSELCFTYLDQATMATPLGLQFRLLVRATGEPFRFGLDPAALAGWLSSRGWELAQDEDAGALARRYLPGAVEGRPLAPTEHVALARRS